MRMIKTLGVLGLVGMVVLPGLAQKEGPAEVGTSQIRIGEEGMVWYATWEVALTEAKRSQRPIFFMSSACQKGSISGVF